MPKKICNYRGCNNLISMKEIYCSKHKIVRVEEVYEKNKLYDEHIRDKKCNSFYHSKEWSIVREEVKRRDTGLCLLCLFNKTIKEMYVVHHIEELKDNWDKRIDEDKLISLCDSCHKVVHNEYNKGTNWKIKTQKKLQNLIEK